MLCIVSIALRAIQVTYWKEKYHDKNYRLYFEIDNIKSSSFTFFEDKADESVYVVAADGERTFIGTLGDELERGRAFKSVSEINPETQETEIKKYYYPESDDNLYGDGRCSIKGYIDVFGKVTKSSFLLGGKPLIHFGDEIKIETEHISVVVRITGASEI